MVGILKLSKLDNAQLLQKMDYFGNQVKSATAPFRDFMTFLGLRSTLNWEPL